MNFYIGIIKVRRITPYQIAVTLARCLDKGIRANGHYIVIMRSGGAFTTAAQPWEFVL